MGDLIIFLIFLGGFLGALCVGAYIADAIVDIKSRKAGGEKWRIR